MAVEIYLEPELEEMTHSTTVNDEWKAMIKELELEGQLSLIKDGDENNNPSPYTFMNNKMVNVFSVLCPSVEDYKSYSKSTIPIEVLSHIALCEKEGYFEQIKVWYDDLSPDPILVGYIKDGSYRYTKHLIARWGDEVLPMEILESRAIERLTETLTTGLEKSIKTVNEDVFDFFNPTRDTGKTKLGFEYTPASYSHTN